MAKKLCSELFINLSFYTTENGLKRLFSPFGVVKQARLIRDPKTQRPKGFGFVKFEKEAEAQKSHEWQDSPRKDDICRICSRLYRCANKNT